MDDTRWGGYGDKFPFGGEGPRSPADEEEFKRAYLSIEFDEGDDCPECGEELVVRTNQLSQEEFLGCSGYKDGCMFNSRM